MCCCSVLLQRVVAVCWAKKIEKCVTHKYVAARCCSVLLQCVVATATNTLKSTQLTFVEILILSFLDTSSNSRFPRRLELDLELVV